jgi:SAM-dependent methyltransferase
MKLSQKIKKALRLKTYTQSRFVKLLKSPRGYYQEWATAQYKKKLALRKRNLTVDNILKNVDRAELERIREKYSNVDGRPDVFWTKYLDYHKWLTLNIRYASELGLTVHPPRHVLDLGCGGGYFLTVCRHLGSTVVGVDLNNDLVLNEMIALFKLNRITWRIRPFVKLPSFNHKFDLITAWMICFNFPPNRPVWTAAEWDFLLTDIAGRLKPRGKVILSLNKQLDDGKLYDEKLGAFFESRGALIEGKRLTFTHDDLVRTIGLRRELAAATATSATTTAATPAKADTQDAQVSAGA